MTQRSSLALAAATVIFFSSYGSTSNNDDLRGFCTPFPISTPHHYSKAFFEIVKQCYTTAVQWAISCKDYVATFVIFKLSAVRKHS